MAMLFPDQLPSGTPQSERTFYQAARKLPADWRVYDGRRVVLPATRGRRAFEGEADFIILHPAWGLLVVEVKGGKRITCSAGSWSSTSNDGRTSRIKDPGAQPSNVAHRIGEFLVRSFNGAAACAPRKL